MTFTKRLRDGVRRGEITCSVRFWISPRVTVGRRYQMEEGEFEVDSIEQIGLQEITGQMARESGYLGVVDLLKVANHGKGQNIYLVRFHYIPSRVNVSASTGCFDRGDVDLPHGHHRLEGTLGLIAAGRKRIG